MASLLKTETVETEDLKDSLARCLSTGATEAGSQGGIAYRRRRLRGRQPRLVTPEIGALPALRMAEMDATLRHALDL
jgi:hypothetical protein